MENMFNSQGSSINNPVSPPIRHAFITFLVFITTTFSSASYSLSTWSSLEHERIIARSLVSLMIYYLAGLDSSQYVGFVWLEGILILTSLQEANYKEPKGLFQFISLVVS
ncbi:hypothetical protein CDL12_07643 [Handroanthus impetiginosus]|uniref:Uncharacterized protein n=1 Tax=Handroanthus impetiginosus TaxID=429701 RepID=A0A2G9HQ67_9LAMI|nr:hypothetical protein CDL12_07643 [Handroanthus impetiginosus]